MSVCHDLDVSLLITLVVRHLAAFFVNSCRRIAFPVHSRGRVARVKAESAVTGLELKAMVGMNEVSLSHLATRSPSKRAHANNQTCCGVDTVKRLPGQSGI